MTTTSPLSPHARESVLLVIPWGLRQVGGVNQVVRRLATGLMAAPGWDAHVMVSREPDAIDRVTSAALPTTYLRLSGPFEGRDRWRGVGSFLRRLPSRLRSLRGLLAAGGYRIVNVHYPSLASLHFVLLRALGLWPHRLVLSFHLSDAQQAADTTGSERALWALLLRAADAIVIPSADLATRLEAIAPGITQSITVIPNGVDVAEFERVTPLPPGLPAHLRDRPLVASVGLFGPRKGHADLLDAIARLKAAFPTLGALIIGADAPYRAELEARRHALGLEQDVAFFPDVPHAELPALLHAATIFALATRAETFCIAILEAGAAGLPVVSTRAPGVVEVVRDTETALLCPIGDVPALADAIRRLLEDPDEARAMAARFKGEIARGLTWTHHHERYVALYRSLTPPTDHRAAPRRAFGR